MFLAFSFFLWNCLPDAFLCYIIYLRIVFSRFFHTIRNIAKFIKNNYLNAYIYIYVCVCVCVCGYQLHIRLQIKSIYLSIYDKCVKWP